MLFFTGQLSPANRMCVTNIVKGVRSEQPEIQYQCRFLKPLFNPSSHAVSLAGHAIAWQALSFSPACHALRMGEKGYGIKETTLDSILSNIPHELRYSTNLFFSYIFAVVIFGKNLTMEEKNKEDNNPWRHHPLFIAYKKFYDGKNVLMGRIIGLVIAIIVIVVCFLLFR